MKILVVIHTTQNMKKMMNIMIKAELEKLRRNIYASKADLAVLEKALEEYETELDAGIEDGSALKADYTYIDEVIAEIEEKFADEYLTDEKKAEKYVKENGTAKMGEQIQQMLLDHLGDK